MLIVDDELDQLETLRRGLTLLDLECVTARSAAEALALLHTPLSIDVLLTDLTMPGRSGAELLDRARSLRPELPALVLTGLVSSPEVKGLQARGIPILRKPFTAERLADAIEALLRSHDEGE